MDTIKIPTQEELKIQQLEEENKKIKEEQAQTNTTLLELLETILLGGM